MEVEFIISEIIMSYHHYNRPILRKSDELLLVFDYAICDLIILIKSIMTRQFDKLYDQDYIKYDQKNTDYT